jgi:hypothetical protein
MTEGAKMAQDNFMNGRRCVLIAAVTLLASCSSTPPENTGLEAAAVTTTETIAVTTPRPPPLNEITFTITAPSSPLFLGTLKVNALPSGSGGVLGSVDPGSASATNPASHSFRLGSAKFQQTRQYLVSNGPPFWVQITYDSVTFAVTEFSVLSTL